MNLFWLLFPDFSIRFSGGFFHFNSLPGECAAAELLDLPPFCAR
ncbi:hypothetical protein FAEPRAA2165_01497 [Faecalibacterium duncaniae]|uniref:Uncharacterized protein n=1 Tax=Faecalibacterium duncaniae (strain DSM 17677 / JCM 31915 / A2-165) TaxID=411483 RepID=C7H5C7_FAED2|nr:hypothetical protein FAEPRAA2165_01497 [Faecalibacterium duncaniae]